MENNAMTQKPLTGYNKYNVNIDEVHSVIGRYMLADGFDIVLDLENSKGARIIDSKTGDPIGNPDIISRGFVYMKENKELIEKTRMKAKNIVRASESWTQADVDHIKNKLREEIGQFLFNQIKRRPMVLPVVIKV